MSITTPTCDLALIYGTDTNPNSSTYGMLTVDVALTPAGDLKLVSGPARLVQDVQRWLLVPQGSYPFDPSYGNPLLGQLLRPGSNNPNVYKDMVKTAEIAFMAAQAQAAASGYLSLDEQVDHFSDPVVVIGDGNVNGPIGALTVTFTIYTRGGSRLPASAAFSALIAA